MNIQTKKYNLINQIIQINDEVLIDTVKNLLDFGLKSEQEDKAEAVTDFWNELSDAQKSRVEASILSMKKGEGKTHSDVMKGFREKYSK